MRETRDEAALQPLKSLITEQPGEDWLEPQRVSLGKRRAGAAITLLKTGDRLSPLEALKITNDPESITQFVARCRERGVLLDDLLNLVDTVDSRRKTETGDARALSDRIIYGLLLTLGSYPVEGLPSAGREQRIAQLIDWYAHDPGPGVHSATGWLLRQWGQYEAVRKIDETPIPYSPQREWFVQRFEPGETAEGEELDDPQPFCLTFTASGQDWISVADGSRMGVCLPQRNDHDLFVWERSVAIG